MSTCLRNFFPALLWCLSTLPLFAQQNIRAWYAQGQVWVVWQAPANFPETYAIYKSSQAFTNAAQATIVGRPFFYEYFPGALIRMSGDTAFAYKIPRPDGSIYTLKPGEALFVETATGTGTAYYGVVEWGKNTFAAGVNRTQNAISYTYDPVNQPVNCHLQYTETLTTGHKANWYCVWLLGKQAQWSGRSDFPVMANVAKNGMPANFIVSEAIGMDTSNGKRIPATHWLHGGGGSAVQCRANGFRVFNIAPAQGISVAHTDDLPQLLVSDGDTLFSTGRTQWFGWTKVHNPFDAGFKAKPGDTIINYTQRRILWIHNWVIRHYAVDPNRVAIQGYSMGSGGACALGKAYPGLFSTVSAFNNGFRRVNEPTITAMLGSVEDNLPTNLRDGRNQVVHMSEVMDFNTPISAPRDLPLFRTWAGKNDLNDRMHWGPDLVAQYRTADSLGWGAQISWDEREHTYETLDVHWILGTLPAQQTYRDNLAYQELFNSKQSFPAFFNHRLDARNNKPGTGKTGTNSGDGDNWGTWGGWHNWDPGTLNDSPGLWEVTAWLTATAPFAGDVSPHNSLKADLAIRKPQQFKPAAGALLRWTVKDAATGSILQSATTTVRADSLVVLPQIEVFKENVRKVRISVSDPKVDAETVASSSIPDITIHPNPAQGPAKVHINSRHDGPVSLRIIGADGRCLFEQNTHLWAGENRLPLAGSDGVPPGIYRILVLGGDWMRVASWVKF